MSTLSIDSLVYFTWSLSQCLVNVLAKRCESTDAQPDNDAQHTTQLSAITRKQMVLYSFDTTTHVHKHIG